ncbi:receptor-type tyrosine-protein phosphatase F-like isoform X1 [Anthonomus grandis grandis]|uniref:receptor-type tyrosine-protein phosphatase F-like isoform X1 n=2 Tax=Anthonomus grandis grandis TaxID=2921223 RepID=UPI0021651C31|nr:receptor-type tyrosine-protein phosphatase F-like isoform X1 [Anthonomus grandis grandis]XP_050296938.1 receptor-type tyrosine-protein phosphatase F-like isoform X1 [Anthonomus grandis grandis]
MVNFDGRGREPSYYWFQYQVPDSSTWVEIAKIPFREVRVETLDSLTKGTNYTGRVFGLIADTDIAKLQYVAIPVFRFSTLCDDLNLDYIKLSIQSTSATFIIEDPNDKLCNLDQTQLFIYTSDNISEKKYYQLKSYQNRYLEFTVDHLDPKTIYRFGLLNLNGMIDLGSFSTTEAKPSAIRNMNFEVDIIRKRMKLTWDPPINHNGDIQLYNITYRIYYIICQRWGPTNSFNTSDGQTTSYTFDNLEFYVGYSVTIKPKNAAGYGPETNKYINIEQLDKITADEVTINRITPGETEVTFGFPDCTKRTGILSVSISYTSVNSWCSNSKRFPDPIRLETKSTITIGGLEPYCNYTASLRFYRGDREFSKRIKTASFQTKESRPNQISAFQCYEKSSNYIAVRWLPPSPPTGELISYFVTILETEFWISDSYIKREENISINKCYLFPEYHCAKFNNLKEQFVYRVEISAYNKGNSLPSLKATLKTLAVIEEPGPPRSIINKWTEENFLELTWYHPNHVNGTLTHFNIEIYKKQKKKKYVEKYELISPANYQPSYSKTIKNLPLPGEFTVTLVSINFKQQHSEGNPTISIMSPPPIPNDTVNIKKEQNVIHFDFNETKYDRDFYRFLYILIGQCRSCKDNLIQFRAELETYHKANDNIYEGASIANDWTLICSCEYEQKSKNCRSILNNNTKYPISHNENYVIGFIWIYKFAGLVRSNYIIKDTENKPYTDSKRSFFPEIFLSCSLLLFLIIIIVSVYFVSKKYNLNILSTSYLCTCFKLGEVTVPKNECLPSKSTDILTEATYVNQEEMGLKKVGRVRPVSRIIFKPLDLLTENDVICPGVPLFKTQNSKRIKLEHFSDYLKNAIKSGELLAQHNTFPRGLQKPHAYGSLPENKIKNRYKNLIAYDQSRVILEKIDGDEFSDYINADYIDGFRHPRAYIATQGPKPNTVSDFWRMVWQENVTHIVMMANVIEGNKKKTEQYWPEINEEEKYGDYTVTYISSKVFANYDCRILELQFKCSTPRKIGHLHFKVWPDHGVPLYPQSLVPFLQTLLRLKNTDFPLVVHCSAGVGRTGTIILCDICLRMAAAEGFVDFFAMLEHLRNNRANLVDNVEQYMLAHLVVLNCLAGMKTQIPVNEKFTQSVNQISNIASQLSYVKSIEWQDDAMKTTHSTHDETRVIIPEKNRFPDILPDPLAQIFLRPYPPSNPKFNSTYINAIQVDGFCGPKRFAVTQFPLPNTIGDFWRLILERNYTVIVCLNDLTHYKDPTCQRFWPEKRECLEPQSGVTVKSVRSKQLLGYIEMIFDIDSDDKHDQKLTVKMIKLDNWAPKELVPPKVSDFISFVEDVTAVARGCGQILLTCYDGATATGLFMALSFLIEKIDFEHECDVCQAIRTIRTSRKQFVGSLEQMKFLYKAAVLYVEEKFNQYSNFQ